MILGIGVDVVEVERVEKAAGKFSGRFLRRVFTSGELTYCRRRADFGRCLAARFAAKEAVLKALGTGLAGGLRWVDIEVVAGSSPGAPEVLLRGKAAARAEEKGVARVHLSMAHGERVAIAFVILEG
ncbi:MAG: holo-ACP synthase [Desulfotomaculales bacterium]